MLPAKYGHILIVIYFRKKYVQTMYSSLADWDLLFFGNIRTVRELPTSVIIVKRREVQPVYRLQIAKSTDFI